MTSEELVEHLRTTAKLASTLADNLSNMSKGEFIAGLENIEQECGLMRAGVIRHSRRLGCGIRFNGEPDRRFRANRKAMAGVDLRFS